MTNFYIEKIIVTGEGKKPSIIEFRDGLNIVCGPSDTGKSYIIDCIDYVFGSTEIPIDENTGYNCIRMVVQTPKGAIDVTRQFGKNTISVSSAHPAIESGDYNTRSGKRSANTDLWPRLIGIAERQAVIWNKNFEKKSFTWRMFLHMILIKEERIIQKPSILLPRQNTANTAALSALLLLITGQSMSDISPREEKKMRLAKRTAVADYIRSQLEHFSQRKLDLDKLSMDGSFDMQAQIDDIATQIEGIEAQVSEAVKRDKQLLEEIFIIDAQLTESNTLLNRYHALRSQYISDIKRLGFVVEGEFHRANVPHNTKCPFCENEVSKKHEVSYVEASKAELQRTQLQLEDLGQAEADLRKERDALEAQLAGKTADKSAVESLLNLELKPRAESLKKSLSSYRKVIEIQSEFSLIGSWETSLKAELFETEHAEEESENEFSAKGRFDRSIVDPFDSLLEQIMRACKYEGVGSARLGLSDFDILVNEKGKGTFGKGYRAFLNTVVALTLMEYLAQHGKYAPGLLIMDSPILSLKERVDSQASDSMKSALFQYMIDHQDNRQVIVIENDIPKLDYQDKAHIVRFTKDEFQGRYGFLEGVR